RSMAKKARPPRTAVRPPVTAPGTDRRPASSLLLFAGRFGSTIALLAVILASGRIVATYSVFNHTFDEPAHIATGMEWLDKKTYTWEPQHPPLARILCALGPYLLGGHTHKLPAKVITDSKDNLEHEGLAILYDGHKYDRTLAAARLGI